MNKKTSIEKILHRELRNLPELEAPHTLIPRVLARIDARAGMPWWKCSWVAWPIQMRVISLFVGALIVGGVTYGANWVSQRVSAFFAAVDLSDRWEGLVSLGRIFETLGRALVLAVQSIEQPWMLVSLSLVLVMYFSCVALGSVAYQVVSRKR